MDLFLLYLHCTSQKEKVTSPNMYPEEQILPSSSTEDDESTASSSDEEEDETAEQCINKKIFLDKSNAFYAFDDAEFKKRFRLNKATVFQLLSKIRNRLLFTPNHKYGLSPLNQLLCVLRFYATGSFQLLIGDSFGIHQSTACRLIHKVSRIIASDSQTYITFPTTLDETVAVKKLFYDKYCFPGILGAIDCTHVPIQSPGGEYGKLFLNGRGYYSLNVQLVCSADLTITNVVARWPGSEHDAKIFDTTHLCYKFENGQITEGLLVGHGGYPCRKYLLTPIQFPCDAAQNRYNAAHAAARNVAEQCHGALKQRFPALRYGLRVHVENVPTIIVAAAVLHNLAISLGDGVPQDDLLCELLATKRQKFLQMEQKVMICPQLPRSLIPEDTEKRIEIIEQHFRYK